MSKAKSITEKFQELNDMIANQETVYKEKTVALEALYKQKIAFYESLYKHFDAAVKAEFGYNIKALHDLVSKQEAYEKRKQERAISQQDKQS